jgi:predicted esterase
MKQLLLLIGVCCSFTLWSQSNCPEEAFLVPQAGNITRTEVVYGSNTGYFNNTLNLRADIYQLQSDNPVEGNRPLIVLAHGGGFVLGSRNDMRSLCEVYASLGYVCASIEYRLYPFFLVPLLDSATVVEVAFNAISDMRGAVRYFKSTVDNGNPYKIDADRIIVGGISAGAIMALHTGYFHEGDPITPEFQTLLDAKGGFEGNTGDSLNLSYNSRVQGIISLSGATFDTLWITSDDPPIMSIHGDADAVLPFGFAREGAFNRVTLYGSSMIHQRADNINLENIFVPVAGGGHTDIYSAPQFAEELITFNQNSLLLLKDIVCNDVQVSTANTMIETQVNLFPNPTRGAFNVQVSEALAHGWGIHVYDSQGRLMHQQQVSGGTNVAQVERPNMGAGWYIVHILSQGRIIGAKVLVTK